MLREKLEDIIKAIKNTDDKGADCAVDHALYKVFGDFDCLDYNYVSVEEGEWTQNHKYQSNDETFKITLDDEVVYLRVSVSRSGSYHTDWYYSVDDVEEVRPATITTVFTEETFIPTNSNADDNQYVCIKVTGEDAFQFCDKVEEFIGEFSEGYDVNVEWKS